MGNQDSPQLGAVLLIGPPGSGKSLLGQALARTHPHSVFEFLNVGLRLRKAGILHRHLQHPTASGRDELRAEARKLLTDACHRLRNTISTAKNREFTATGADQLHTRYVICSVWDLDRKAAAPACWGTTMLLGYPLLVAKNQQPNILLGTGFGWPAQRLLYISHCLLHMMCKLSWHRCMYSAYSRACTLI